MKIALNSAGLEINEKEQTEYLLFLGLNEIEAITNVCFQHWDTLMQTDSNYESARVLEEEIKKKEEDTKSAPREHRQSLRTAIREMRDKLKSAKDTAKKAIPKDIERAVLHVLDGGKAADLALFGRMVANLPAKTLTPQHKLLMPSQRIKRALNSTSTQPLMTYCPRGDRSRDDGNS